MANIKLNTVTRVQKSEVDLGLLQHLLLSALNYYHKALHLGCCNSPRFASENI